ncbi:putative plant lipid transfer protein/Par allergen [Lupinus albus]|uniref:Putative plant lipid transfer protein/Par allergen n=1 Tax=Lupinus albus TaxID=3870 RepID=A0A6A4QE90_LUPAL|nr:putative plant lipid transfer protein/Par allergen [Lupinus albus]
MKNVFVAFLSLLAILVLVVEPGQSFNFEKARDQLSPCLNYVIGIGNTPSIECCNGVHALESSLPTREDRRAACRFLKSTIKSYPIITDEKISSLLKQCGAKIPFSKNIICGTIP